MSAAPARQGDGQQQGLIAALFRLFGTLFFVLLFSFIFSIIAEWVGMTYFWPDQKVTHAKELLIKEFSYLNQDFRKTLVAEDGVVFAKKFSDKMYYTVFEITGLKRMLEMAQQPFNGNEKGTKRLMQDIVNVSRDYLLSAFYTTQTYAVRLAVLVMALPLFAIFMVIGLTDGLVRRDLRRWRGGRESSLVYAYAKHSISPSFMAAWLIYLCLPISLHPNFVILPFAVLFGYSMMMMASKFKKYI